MAHTVVVSDVHLWEALPGDGLWMRYRQERFFPDESLSALLDALLAKVGRDELELVFNGDVFDFDVAPVRDSSLDHTVRCVTEDAAVVRLEAILDHHPVFVAAVGRVLDAGKRVTFVAGNHDAQLHWPRVQAVLTSRIAATSIDPGAQAQIRFVPWFHRTRDGIHIEHGNQYDRFCSFASPLRPFASDGTRLQLNVGSLVVHHVVGRLGYFNPNHDESFLLSAGGYARHFFRHYAFARESLIGTWALGTLRVAWSLLRHPGGATDHDEALAAHAREHGLDLDALRAHLDLTAPADVQEFLRALKLDKALLCAVSALAAALTVAYPRAAITLALAAIVAHAAFHVVVPDKPLHEVYVELQLCQRQIARLHHARAVVFGHTHGALGAWENGVFYGNCGTWSPRFDDVECSVPFERGRPFIWLVSGADGALSGGLYRYIDGEIVAVGVRNENNDDLEVGNAA